MFLNVSLAIIKKIIIIIKPPAMESFDVRAMDVNFKCWNNKKICSDQ